MKTCMTCLYSFTHEKCDGCLHTPEDYETYRTIGRMAPFRYLYHVESDPLAIMCRLHALQLLGHRPITLGPGEADIYATSTPEATSKHLHYVAKQCGYCCHMLRMDAFGDVTLRLCKDGGPFTMRWRDNQLISVETPAGTYWKRMGVL